MLGTLIFSTREAECWQIFSALLEQYICVLVLLGKYICTIKCTPKQVTYLSAKVGAMLHQQRSQIQRGSNTQHKTNVTFCSELDMGDNIFRRPDRVMGHKTKKHSTNKIRATKRFTALVRHGPRKPESRPKRTSGRQYISLP